MPLPHSSHDTVNILEALGIIFKRKKMIMLSTIFASVMAVAYSLQIPKQYEATAKVLPAQQNQNTLSALMSQTGGLANLAGGLVAGSSTTDLYAAMLKTDTIYDAVIDKFELMKLTGKELRSDVYSILRKAITVDSGKEGIISITVSSRDPQRSADMANFIVQQLNDFSVRLNTIQSGQNRQFLEERLSRAKADLGIAEDNLKAFQAKNKMFNVPDQTRATIEGVAQLTAQLATQEVQLATLQRQFTDASQEVRNQKTAIERLRSQIARLEGGGAGTSAVPSLGAVPDIGQEYTRLMREFKTQETIVNLLVNQYELAKLAEANQSSTLQLLQKAKKPERKSKPKRAQIVLVVTFASFFLSIIAAFVIERFSTMPEEELTTWRSLWSELLSFRTARKPE